MKKWILILFLCTWYIAESFGAVHQVNNVNPAVGHFASLQAAINAASDGDTIYIHGTHESYGTITLNKRLTLIGPGWSPQMQNSQTAKINQINLNTTIDPISGETLNPDSSVFVGIVVLQNISGWTYNASNLHVERVYFPSASSNLSFFGGSNHQFIGCWFSGGISPSGPGLDNWLFLNCIFDPNSSFVSNESLINPSFVQCIFTRRTNNPMIDMFSTFSGATNASFVNNIFMLVNPATHCNNCTFLNNMTFGAGAPNLNNFGIVSEDNFIATSLGFANFNVGTPYSPNADLSLLAGSPAIAAGVNGEDLGVMGGQPGNFVQFGQPDIPKLDLLQVINPMVKQGDELIFRVRATAPEN